MIQQAHGRSSTIFFCFLSSLFFHYVFNAQGATHIVGDSDGWTRSIDSTKWTDGKEFHVNDILLFNYDKALHNVMQVNATAYANCEKNRYLRLFHSGSDKCVLSEAGKMWYICGVDDHCENGQKLTINVDP